jgi:hypothetical protein
VNSAATGSFLVRDHQPRRTIACARAPIPPFHLLVYRISSLEPRGRIHALGCPAIQAAIGQAHTKTMNVWICTTPQSSICSFLWPGDQLRSLFLIPSTKESRIDPIKESPNARAHNARHPHPSPNATRGVHFTPRRQHLLKTESRHTLPNQQRRLSLQPQYRTRPRPVGSTPPSPGPDPQLPPRAPHTSPDHSDTPPAVPTLPGSQPFLAYPESQRTISHP